MTESRLVIAILSAVSLMLALSFVVLLLTYLERKALARIQQRMGPTRVGYRGTLQPLADAVKLITKEDIIPAWSDKVVYWIAPVAVFVPAFVIWVTIPIASEVVLQNLDMGLFYIVFSFFKFLDYKNFPASFSMYDPIAKILPLYGWIYPIIETLLGLFFLLRYQLLLSLITTIILLGATTIGVTRSLLKKSDIQCACLGTALNLPMTKATFIENCIMILMAVWMLLSKGSYSII